MMQSLKRNWLVAWKLTSGFWQILTRTLESLKNVHVNELLLSKLYIVWAKQGTEKLSFMSLKIDATFGGELTCCFKTDMRNLTIFDSSTWKSEKFLL